MKKWLLITLWAVAIIAIAGLLFLFLGSNRNRICDGLAADYICNEENRSCRMEYASTCYGAKLSGHPTLEACEAACGK